MDKNVVVCPFDPNEEEIPLREFGSTLFQSFHQHSTAVAIVDVVSGEKITYQELRLKSETVARHLLSFGCRIGDVIGIFSPNSIEWMVISAAAFRIGAVTAGINCLLKAGELKYQLSKCKPTVLFVTRETGKLALQATEGITCKVIVKGGLEDCISLESLFDVIEKLPQLPQFEQLHLRPNDPAVVMFSSGTTGPQKAVLISHYNLQAVFITMRHPESDPVYPEHLVFAPLSHVAGFLWVLCALALGYKALLIPRFDFRVYLKCLQDYKLEKVQLVPPIAIMLAKSPEVDEFQLGHFRGIFCGAAPLSSGMEDLLTDRFHGLTIRQCYGLTETMGPCCAVPYLSKKDQKPATIGVPLINVQMKIVDMKTGKSLGPKQPGEICVKSPLNTPGYKDNPEATAELIDKDGWLHSGDIGYYDEDGYFFIVGRLKELIKYNAHQVPPVELEAVLMSHPQVVDTGVFGLPDPNAGELPTAWVVLRPESKVTELELQQFVSERVAPYKRLRGGIKFVASIPKNATGKILRHQMQEENSLKGKL